MSILYYARDISGETPVLVRMHAMDPMLDIIGTGPKGRAHEFGDAMRIVADEGAVLLFSCETRR